MTIEPELKFIKIEDSSRPNYNPRIAYLQWGNLDDSSKKTLVCLHGLSRNGHDFDYLARNLSDKYNIICPEIVGRGNSDWLEDKKLYEYPTYIKDVIFLLKKLNIKNADVVGFSMGGIIAMVIATKFEAEKFFDKIVLNDIGPLIPAKYLRGLVSAISTVEPFDSLEEAQDDLRVRFAEANITNEEHWQHCFKYMIVKNSDAKYSLAYDPAIASKPPLLARIFDIRLWKFWKNVKNPILSIRGNLSELFLEKTQKKLMKLMPNMKHITFENIGHAPSLMEDEQIKAIRDFLLN